MDTGKKPKLIAAGLVQKGDTYLLIKEVMESSGQERWIIPGGSVEFGENLEDAVKRELMEEVGMEVKIERFLAFREANFAKFGYHTVIFFYLVTTEDDEIKITEEKILDGKYFGVEEIKDLELVDSAKWLFETLGLL